MNENHDNAGRFAAGAAAATSDRAESASKTAKAFDRRNASTPIEKAGAHSVAAISHRLAADGQERAAAAALTPVDKSGHLLKAQYHQTTAASHDHAASIGPADMGKAHLDARNAAAAQRVNYQKGSPEYNRYTDRMNMHHAAFVAAEQKSRTK